MLLYFLRRTESIKADPKEKTRAKFTDAAHSQLIGISEWIQHTAGINPLNEGMLLIKLDFKNANED